MSTFIAKPCIEQNTRKIIKENDAGMFGLLYGYISVYQQHL